MVITNWPIVPMKEENGTKVPKKFEEYTDDDCKIVQHNELAKYYLFNCMSTDEFSKVMSCETAKQIWGQLELTYEGTNKVKDAKINLLTSVYESFSMQTNESITSLHARFLVLVNDLEGLGKRIDENERVVNMERLVGLSRSP